MNGDRTRAPDLAVTQPERRAAGESPTPNLRVKITPGTYDRAFGSVLALAKRRHTVKQPLHSIECVAGDYHVKGGSAAGQQSLSTPETTQALWYSLVQNPKLKKYLRRSE